MQQPLPGLEDYVCTFQCLRCKLCPGVCSPPDLSACPYPQCLCPANDWGLGDEVEYPEHFSWRLEHLTATQKRQLMEPGSDCMILTPDCLDQFYPEPPGNVYRCNRCHSTNIVFGESWIVCASCEYNEPLIDFPENGVSRRNDLEEIICRIRQATKNPLQAIIYLWTRDGNFPVNAETEAYVKQHLQAILGREPLFSDAQRADMAKRLAYGL